MTVIFALPINVVFDFISELELFIESKASKDYILIKNL